MSKMIKEVVLASAIFALAFLVFRGHATILEPRSDAGADSRDVPGLCPLRDRLEGGDGALTLPNRLPCDSSVMGS
ncbi:MAG: hypothetical protein U5O39_09605 [Gammaproteobacteria bacterium]|nr:hypothetical protein [Gammaproteobacteria bacterium]